MSGPLSGPHPVRHLHVSRPAVQRVRKSRIASELFVALAGLVISFLLYLLCRFDSREPTLTVLVQIRGCLLHGGEFAGPFLLRKIGTRAWRSGSSVIVSWSVVVIVSPRRAVRPASSVAGSLLVASLGAFSLM